MFKFFDQYRGLRRELYVVFWGRIVTAMGGIMWPMLTLILTGKMGYSSSEAATIVFLVGLIQLPCVVVGGKIADRFNLKNVIVAFDMVTVTGFFICAFLPLNFTMLLFFCIGGIFAQMEWPCYDALIANLSTLEERERAYSLNYMGVNVGFVLGPSISGFLFENHLDIAFIVSAAATFSSTILIFFLIKDITPSVDTSEAALYEEAKDGASTKDIFSSCRVLIVFVLCIGVINSLYSVSNGFLIPVCLDEVFPGKGAAVFGTLASLNAIVVIIGTPLLTGVMSSVMDTSKLFMGFSLQVAGYIGFALSGTNLPFYYIAMTVFTMGEVLISLGHKPYITKRVPSSHRGRISSVVMVTATFIQGVCLFLAGRLGDNLSLSLMWGSLIAIGVLNLCMIVFLKRTDRHFFPLLYQNK